MKRVIFALGVLFVFACSKTSVPATPPNPVVQEEAVKFTTNLDTGTYNVADTLPLVVTVSSKATASGFIYSILITWTDSSKQIFKLDTSLTVSSLSLKIPGLNKTGSYSLLVTVTSKSSSTNTFSKTINSINKFQQIAGIELIPVDPRLKSNGKGVITVPVVIINYIPTTDGKYLDRWKTFSSNVTWDVGHKLTMTRVNEKILKEKIIDKYSIEEGTRFRDYGKNVTKPYIDIDVVAYINVYDLKLIKVGTRMVDTTMNDSDDGINNPVAIDWHKIDFNDLFERINLKNYVNNFNAKEVWFTSFTKETGVNSYNVQESSMSPSLTSVDPVNISNGGGDLKDLPRFNNTYIVFVSNGWRGVDTDLHVRGHQIERQLEYIDNEKFYYGNFAKDRNTIGGYTHTPVNTIIQYDYNNTSIVSSDITTWKPSRGIGIQTNNLSWLNLTYTFSGQMVAPGPFATGNEDWNKDAQTKWFIYWWQSIPGYNNNIEDNSKKISNWWDIIYNWDNAIKNKTKLVQ